jgi:glutathione S-transferase
MREMLKSPVTPPPGGLTFYTHGICPYAQRVAFALEEKGVSFAAVEVDLSKKPRWFSQLSRSGLVPAIQLADGRVQTESLDIIELLEAEFPESKPLIPADRSTMDRLVRSCGSLESAGWRMLGGSWSFPRGHKPSASTIAGLEKVLKELSSAIEESGRPFLCGAEPTLADIALGPFITRFALVLPRTCGYEITDSSESMRVWLHALHSRPSFQATFPEPGAFLRAVLRFSALDYFDRTSASLRQPEPA